MLLLFDHDIWDQFFLIGSYFLSNWMKSKLLVGVSRSFKRDVLGETPRTPNYKDRSQGLDKRLQIEKDLKMESC